MANILSQRDFASRLFTAALTAVIVILVGCEKRSSQPESANVLHHRFEAKVETLDPAEVGDTHSEAVASEIFELLYGYHYLKRPYQIVPVLAEDMPDISENMLTYTIKIKKGVYFADDRCFAKGIGRELKATDFIFAWKRIANIKQVSKSWWIFDGRIVGLDEFREYTKTCKTALEVDYSRPVEGFTTPDDYTLVIKLKRPCPRYFFCLLIYLPHPSPEKRSTIMAKTSTATLSEPVPSN